MFQNVRLTLLHYRIFFSFVSKSGPELMKLERFQSRLSTRPHDSAVSYVSRKPDDL